MLQQYKRFKHLHVTAGPCQCTVDACNVGPHAIQIMFHFSFIWRPQAMRILVAFTVWYLVMLQSIHLYAMENKHVIQWRIYRGDGGLHLLPSEQEKNFCCLNVMVNNSSSAISCPLLEAWRKQNQAVSNSSVVLLRCMIVYEHSVDACDFKYLHSCCS